MELFKTKLDIGITGRAKVTQVPQDFKKDLDPANLDLEDGEAVSSWQGAEQLDSQYQPTYQVGSDGLPYVLFDGSSWMFGPEEFIPSSMSQDHTIYAIMERIGTGSAVCLGWNDTSEGGSFQNGWSILHISARRFAVRWGGDGGTGNRDQWRPGERFCFANRVRANWWQDVQFKGTSQAGHVARTGVPPDEEDVPFILGSVSSKADDPPVGSLAQFRLYRLIMYERLIDPVEHQAIQELLNNKYNTDDMG